MKKGYVSNPTSATVMKCKKCGKNFSVAVRRDECLNCKPLTQHEFHKLMNYNGAHVALNWGSGVMQLVS